MYQFPSGVQFESMGAYNDILYIALPRSGKLHIRDVEYLGLIVENLDMSGLSISIGDFTTFIPVSALREYREGHIDLDTFLKKWGGIRWHKATAKSPKNGLLSLPGAPE